MVKRAEHPAVEARAKRTPAPRGNGEAHFTDAELEAFVASVWMHGRPVEGFDPRLWRKDECGAWMRRDHFGHRDDPFGWKMESVAVDPPVFDGLLRPFQWRNRYDRAAKRPVCAVTADPREAAAPRNVEAASA